MLTLIKNDLYENKFNIGICLIGALVFSFVLVNLDKGLESRRFLGVLLMGLLASLSFGPLLNNIYNGAYKDLLKYPLSKSDIVRAKFVNFFIFTIIALSIGLVLALPFDFIKENIRILLISILLVLAYFSFIIPLAFFLADKSQAFIMFGISLIGASFGFAISFVINSGFNIVDIVNKNILLIILSLILLVLSYKLSTFILNKKEF